MSPNAPVYLAMLAELFPSLNTTYDSFKNSIEKHKQNKLRRYVTIAIVWAPLLLRFFAISQQRTILGAGLLFASFYLHDSHPRFAESAHLLGFYILSTMLKSKIWLIAIASGGMLMSKGRYGDENNSKYADYVGRMMFGIGFHQLSLSLSK